MAVTRRCLADERLHADNIAAHLAHGGVLLVENLTPETVAGWGQRASLAADLTRGSVFQCSPRRGARLTGGAEQFRSLLGESRRQAALITRYTLDEDDAASATLGAHGWPHAGRTTSSRAEQHKVGFMYRRLEQFGGPRAALVSRRCGMGQIIISQLHVGRGRGDVPESSPANHVPVARQPGGGPQRGRLAY